MSEINFDSVETALTEKNDISPANVSKSKSVYKKSLNRTIDDSDKKSFYEFSKRIIDVVVSLLGLIVLSPIFLIISIGVKLGDGGSVFYKHSRLGLNGKKIELYKFRSMKINADNLEDMLTPEQLEIYKTEFKIENDPRITKFGHFLRETSLDELPQLLNILKGDLSIIGPRPIIEDELDNYGDDAQYFLSVKPGLTGYWQAYARNSAIYSTGERQKMELYYIQNRSLVFDIKIFFKTFVSIFSKTGS